jgi:hypothetical protein
MNPHTIFCNKIVEQVSTLPKARVFKRVAGHLLTPQGTPVRATLQGQADLYGFHGRTHFEVEVKVGRDKLKPGQEEWGAMCEKLGVPYITVHAKDFRVFDERARDVKAWVASLVKP